MALCRKFSFVAAASESNRFYFIDNMAFVFLRVICACGGISAVACPVGVEELPSGAVQPLIGVCAEVITLRLQKIRGQAVGGIVCACLLYTSPSPRD